MKFYEYRFIMEFTLLDELKVTSFFRSIAYFPCACVHQHYSNLVGAVMLKLIHRISWNLINLIISWNLTYIGFDLNQVYVANQLAMLFCVSYDEWGDHISSPMAQNCIKLKVLPNVIISSCYISNYGPKVKEIFSQLNLYL